MGTKLPMLGHDGKITVPWRVLCSFLHIRSFFRSAVETMQPPAGRFVDNLNTAEGRDSSHTSQDTWYFSSIPASSIGAAGLRGVFIRKVRGHDRMNGRYDAADQSPLASYFPLSGKSFLSRPMFLPSTPYS